MKLLLFTSLLMGACYVHGLTSSLQQITDNIGSNPSNVGFYIYVPTTRQSRPAIVVAVHACHGKAQDVYSGTQYASLADQYGFIVIYPNSPNSADSCWDVSSSASLTHNGGGDSLGIVNMAKWTMNKYNGDSGRIFVTGTSSGAMMTNLLLGAYPDVFAAGVAFAGVPYGCFAGPSADYWNSQCATGQNIKTAQQWGDLVRSAYSGYSGKRPKLLEFHGTADATLYYQNLLEENKQWSNVFGISFSHNNTNTPISGYTEMVFGDGTQYKSYSAAGVTHNIPTREGDVMKWFGLPGSPSTGTTTTITTKTTTTSSKPATTATSGSSTGGAAHYAQCGGIGYTGPTSCVSPYTCQYSNAYYSQCL